MKNYLLTLPLVLFSATASFAQTTPETAIDAQAGECFYSRGLRC